MNVDLEALLALQSDDQSINEIEKKLVEFAERSSQLDATRAQAVAAVERAAGLLEQEETRRRAISGKVDQYRQLQERQVAQLDQVRKQREADAATAQIDLTRRVLLQEESELNSTANRITDLRRGVEQAEAQLAEVEAEQLEAREVLAAERVTIEEAIGAARAKREELARKVSAAILGKYERIRRRQPAGALFLVHNHACGFCHTAIPMQRRNVMHGGRTIEICEGCGVLLYALS